MTELEKYLKDHIIVVGGVGIGIAFIQVCNLTCSCTVSIGGCQLQSNNLSQM